MEKQQLGITSQPRLALASVAIMLSLVLNGCRDEFVPGQMTDENPVQLDQNTASYLDGDHYKGFGYNANTMAKAVADEEARMKANQTNK